MVTTLLIVVALLVACAALVLAFADHRRQRYTRRNGHDAFVAWDWPPRPVNGHDHPEPPELEREPA